jgi:hypothetical protein
VRRVETKTGMKVPDWWYTRRTGVCLLVYCWIMCLANAEFHTPWNDGAAIALFCLCTYLFIIVAEP